MTRFFTIFTALLLIALPVQAAPVVGQPAPDFTGTDSHGGTHHLADYLGKTVVLEWTNHECPYVVKHYETNNMQTLQKEATDDGVIWLSVVSSAEGKQGHTTNEEANAVAKDVGSHATARILDPSGTIGNLYEAKTTPHMFVVNPQGVLVYAGGIDDNPSVKQDTVENAHNYVRAALADLKAGKPVETSSTKPYGCSVKY